MPQNNLEEMSNNEIFSCTFPLKRDNSQRFSLSPKMDDATNDLLNKFKPESCIYGNILQELDLLTKEERESQADTADFLSITGKAIMLFGSLRALCVLVPMRHLLTAISLMVGSTAAYTGYNKYKQLKPVTEWPVSEGLVSGYKLKYKISSPVFSPGWFLELDVIHPHKTKPSKAEKSKDDLIISKHSFRLTRDYFSLSKPTNIFDENVQKVVAANLPGSKIFCRVSPHEFDENMYVELNATDESLLQKNISKSKFSFAVGSGLCVSAILRELMGQLRKFV